MNYLDRAENIIKNVPNEEELLAYIYATKAHIQIATGEFDKASDNLVKAEKVKPKTLRTYLGANVTKHLKSQIYLAQGNNEKALELVSETIDAPNAINTKSHNIKNIEDRSILLAPEYITKAKILNNLKKYDEAFKVVNDNVYKHIKGSNSENFHILLARTLVEIARAENGLKKYDRALSHIEDSIGVLTKDSSRNLASSKNLYLANALFTIFGILHPVKQ
jgi:tetratricopeptide (TPR) repeat protein